MTYSTVPRSADSVALLALSLLVQSSRVVAQSGDGGGASGIQPGELGSDPNSQADAASGGADTGYVNLSKGATIAIAVIVTIVVILGVTSAVLFYLAKKRQWKIKEGLRRSVRRVGSVVRAVTTPMTPKKMTFSPVERQRKQVEKDDLIRKANENLKSSRGRSKGSDSSSNDLEKGLGVAGIKVPQTEAMERDRSTSESSGSGKKRPNLPNVKIPSSKQVIASPQTPMWQKVFGR